MSYVTAVRSGAAARVDYRLAQQHGCEEHQLGYRTDLRERPLEWIGTGFDAYGPELARLGVRAGAELTPAQFDIACALAAGFHPVTGEQLVVGKRAIYPDAKVSAQALVEAITAESARRGVPVEALLERNAKFAPRFATMRREVVRKGAGAMTRADHAGAIATAAGLDPERVWGPGVHAAAVANLTEQRTVFDPKTGAPAVVTVPRRVDVGIKFFDIEIDLPKSFSVLLAVAPEDVAARVEKVYADAVRSAFGWVEGRTSFAMRGEHGHGKRAERVETDGFTGWVMIHRTARPVDGAQFGDPHWHAHITVPNLVHRGDGTFATAAAGGRDLMRHAPALGAVTRAQARQVLSEELGIEFARNTRTGIWEVAAIPDATLRRFSKRGIEVTSLLEQLGLDPSQVSAGEARIHTRDTRTAKDHTTAASDTTLREYWQAEMRTAHTTHPRREPDPDALAATVFTGAGTGAVRSAVGERNPGAVADVARILADPEHGLTSATRRFSRLDALAAAADALPEGATIAEIETLTDRVLADARFVPLTPAAAGSDVAGARGSAGARRQRGAAHMTDAQLYTTADVIAAEQTILARAAAAPGAGRAVVPAGTLELAVDVVEAAQGFTLSGEQRAALATVTSSGAGIELIRGEPGTGKTTLMRAARVAWESAGHTVAGAATAAVAAQNLATESGIESRTVAQWLHHLDRDDRGLADISVLVLDEANLTDDRARARLYDAAAAAGTKVVEIGDPAQLRGVGCGSMFGYLHQHVGGPVLTENRRQHDEDARRIVRAFRAGHHHEALQQLAAGGRVHATETGHEALAAIVAAWLARADGAPDPHALTAGLLMLAPTNAAVERINTATQTARAQLGHLGAGHTYTSVTGVAARFHVGDQVLLRRNDRATHPDGTARDPGRRAVEGSTVLNGYRGIVTATGPDGVRVEWRTAEGSVDTALASPAFIAAGGLTLGYAITAHKAEGLTVAGDWTRPDGTRHRGDVLVYAAGMDNPAAYVSLSRPRGDAILFAARADLDDEHTELTHGVPGAGEPDMLTARVAAALAQRAAATADNANDRPALVDLGHTPDHADSTSSRGGGVAAERDVVLEETIRGEAAEQLLDVSPEAVFARMHRWRTEAAPDDEPARAAPEPAELTAVRQLRERRNEQAVQASNARARWHAAEAAASAVGVTDADRDRFSILLAEARIAKARDDASALEAAHAARSEFLAGLGEEKVELLRAEHRAEAPLAVRERNLDVAERQLDRAIRHYLDTTGDPDPAAALAELGDTRFTPSALREAARTGEADELQRLVIDRAAAVAAAHFEQQNRPHGTLTDDGLTHAIAATTVDLATTREQVTAAQARLDAARAAFGEGSAGPRETELEHRLAALRGAVAAADELPGALARETWLRQQYAQTGQVAAAAEQAREHAGWWQRSEKTRQEQLAAAARGHQAQLQPAQAAADREVRRLTDQIHSAVGYHHTTADLIDVAHRALADAEHRHLADVATARHLDRFPVDFAQRNLASQRRALEHQQAELAALREERTHRGGQPDDTRRHDESLRRDHRTGEHLQQADERAERREQLHRQLANRDRREEQYYDHLRHGPGHDFGHGMRM